MPRRAKEKKNQDGATAGELESRYLTTRAASQVSAYYTPSSRPSDLVRVVLQANLRCPTAPSLSRPVCPVVSSRLRLCGNSQAPSSLSCRVAPQGALLPERTQSTRQLAPRCPLHSTRSRLRFKSPPASPTSLTFQQLELKPASVPRRPKRFPSDVIVCRLARIGTPAASSCRSTGPSPKLSTNRCMQASE